MSDGYQPKLNRDALLQGYVGADPKAVGLVRGYTQQQVDRSNLRNAQQQQQHKQQEEQPKRRPNPYIR